MDFLVPALAGLCGIALGFGLCWMGLSGKVASLREKLTELDQLKSERTELHERAITAEVNVRNMEQRLREREEQQKLEFQNTATQIFETISTKFATNSEKQLGDLLLPLRERIVEFQKLVTDNFGEHGKEQHTLKAEISRIVAMNEQMRLQTENLTKALRGDVKAQGNWGEIILERILQESGLQRGVGYTVQGSSLGLTNADGGRQQPDVIVNLPDGKHVIIDSKVTLTHYERYCGEEEPALKDAHLKQFLNSVRAHVKGLEGKAYQDNDKLITPDFVLMFMPVEGAYSVAMQQDNELHHYAWERKIVIVCPSTLFATLRTIASLWRIEQQNKNALEIARVGGGLYDKFVMFIDNMQDIGKKLASVQASYDTAMQRLSTGNGNVMARVEKLKQLGSKTSKSMPAGLLFETGGEEDDTEELPKISGATS